MEDYIKEVPASAGDNRKHPAGLRYLFFTEMWERFGYYLMIGILFLYMKDTKMGGLGWDTARASDVYGTFIALVYLTPFIGGLLADRLLGYRRSIMIGCALMGLGYLGLAIPDASQAMYGDLIMSKELSFYISLGFIIIGTGFFKANISTLLGNLYSEPRYKSRKDSGYSIFYMGINIGAFVCNFFAAFLRNEFNWGAAFAAAGAGMFIALAIFAAGNHTYKHVDTRKPAEPEDMPLGKMLGVILGPAAIGALVGFFIPGNIFGSNTTDAFIFACLPIIGFFINLYMRASRTDKQPIGALLAIMGVVIVFWAIFKQNGTALTEWAQHYTDREVPAAVAEPIEKLGFLQTIGLEEKTVPDYDPQFRTETVNDQVVTKQGVDPYLNNLPKDEWPTEEQPLYLINTELFQSVNPFFIVVFTPLVLGFFTWMRRRKREPSTPAKLNLGLLISALSSVVMIGAVFAAQNGLEKSSAWWLIGTYAVITIGELFLSPMGLSLVSKLSPPRFAGLLMGAWSLSTSIGNKLSGVLSSLWDSYEEKEYFFIVNIALLLVAALSIYLMLPWLRAVVNQHTGEDK